MVVGRFIEIEDPEAFPHPPALVVAERDLHAVAHQRVLLPVGGGDALRSVGRGDLPHRVLVGCIGAARVQGGELRAQRARQYHLAIGNAAEQAVRPEVFSVVGVDGFPAEPFFQVVGGGLLDEGVFGVGGDCHPRRSSRHGADAVERYVGIPGDEDEPFGLSLGDQHPVERVTVVRREGACLLGMVERHE